MKTFIGKNGLDKSWQNDFPENTECCRCGANSRIGFVSMEDGEEESVCSLHSNTGEDGKFWPHDRVAVAVYFCEDCLETTALYNQA